MHTAFHPRRSARSNRAPAHHPASRPARQAGSVRPDPRRGGRAVTRRGAAQERQARARLGLEAGVGAHRRIEQPPWASELDFDSEADALWCGAPAERPRASGAPTGEAPDKPHGAAQAREVGAQGAVNVRNLSTQLEGSSAVPALRTISRRCQSSCRSDPRPESSTHTRRRRRRSHRPPSSRAGRRTAECASTYPGAGVARDGLEEARSVERDAPREKGSAGDRRLAPESRSMLPGPEPDDGVGPVHQRVSVPQGMGNQGVVLADGERLRSPSRQGHAGHGIPWRASLSVDEPEGPASGRAQPSVRLDSRAARVIASRHRMAARQWFRSNGPHAPGRINACERRDPVAARAPRRRAPRHGRRACASSLHAWLSRCKPRVRAAPRGPSSGTNRARRARAAHRRIGRRCRARRSEVRPQHDGDAVPLLGSHRAARLTVHVEPVTPAGSGGESGFAREGSRRG